MDKSGVGGKDKVTVFDTTLRDGEQSPGAALNINEKIELFSRYDQLSSNIPQEFNKPWNLADDGSALITGIQFQPIRQVRIALSYRDWVPSASNMDNTSFVYLNLEVSL